MKVKIYPHKQDDAREAAMLEAVANAILDDAARYRWLRAHGSCPFAETDAVWDSPQSLDAAIDADMMIEQR